MIPRAPLLLGLAGLIPFVWGAATLLSFDLNVWSLQNLGTRFTAPFVLLNYGTIILAFMSGVLWGFATKARENAALFYAFSVLPALWVFFTIGAGAATSAMFLITGFIALLALDWTFSKAELTPPWWMKLRLLLTTIVIACLALVL